MKGIVVYYHEEDGWHWKVTHDGAIISSSDESFLTRRGAMDDWNQIQRVVDRLQQEGTSDESDGRH